MAPLAAQRPGKLIGTVAEFRRRAFDALLGDRRNISRQRRVVEYDRDGGRGKPALLGDVSNGNHRIPYLEGRISNNPENSLCKASARNLRKSFRARVSP